MSTIILTIHLLLAAAIVGLVLMQRSEGGALGIGQRPDGLVSARGSANFLTRATALLAACFFATSILLALIGREASNSLPDLLAPAADAPASGQRAPAPLLPQTDDPTSGSSSPLSPLLPPPPPAPPVPSAPR